MCEFSKDTDDILIAWLCTYLRLWLGGDQGNELHTMSQAFLRVLMIFRLFRIFSLLHSLVWLVTFLSCRLIWWPERACTFLTPDLYSLLHAKSSSDRVCQKLMVYMNIHWVRFFFFIIVSIHSFRGVLHGQKQEFGISSVSHITLCYVETLLCLLHCVLVCILYCSVFNVFVLLQDLSWFSICFIVRCILCGSRKCIPCT